MEKEPQKSADEPHKQIMNENKTATATKTEKLKKIVANRKAYKLFREAAKEINHRKR